MRKFRNRRRFLGALAGGALLAGLWVPVQAVDSQAKKCDAEDSRGNENSRKNCPTTTTTSSSTSTSTSTTSSTTTTTAPPSIDDILPYEYTYPDLVPDVTEVYIGSEIIFDEPSGTFLFGPPKLRFDTMAQNRGAVAVDIQSEDVTNEENPPASQCVAWTATVCRERRIVGNFEIHPDHGHIHFGDFAKYELRRLLADDSPDMSATGLVGVSDKVSFCLIDVEKIRDDAVPVATYTTCNAYREGISPGWSDVYGADLEGQEFPLDGVTDGRYAIVVNMNYDNGLFESDYSNNRVTAIVRMANLGTELASAELESRTWS